MFNVIHLFLAAPAVNLWLLSMRMDSVASVEVLKQLIVITRHGSRTPLRKDGNLSEKVTDGVLTPLGQKQHYDLGQWLYDRYENTSGLIFPYDGTKMRLESSSFERTITSANSLALGLFGPEARKKDDFSLLPFNMTPANVPVYVREQPNDVFMRAYDKCPAYQERLGSLYESKAWIDIELENKAFLTKLASLAEFGAYANDAGYIPLSELWNVYDLISVANIECGNETGIAMMENNPICNDLNFPVAGSLLTESEWETVQKLSHAAEILKYGYETAGEYVGVNLWLEMVKRMNSSSSTFNLFSAHYPTMLGLFSAIKADFFQGQVIPHYGAAILLEVTEDTITGDRYFQMLYKADELPVDDGRDFTEVSLENICASTSSKCLVSDLITFFEGWDTARWCQECENDSVDTCVKTKLSQLLNESSANGGSANGGSVEADNPSASEADDGDDGLSVVGSFFVGFFVAVLALLAGIVVWSSHKTSQMQHARGSEEELADVGPA